MLDDSSFLGKKPFSQIITAVLLLATFWVIKAPTLLLLVLWYAASGPIFSAARIVRDFRKPHAAEPPVDEESADRKLA